MRTIVLANARVVTCNERNTIASAIAIGDGQLLAVGDRDTVRAAARPQAQVVDLGGRAVILGLIDTHPHLLHFGALAEPLVDLADARSQQDIAGRIARRASQLAPGEWLMTTPVGEPHYFIRHSWRDLAEGELPDRAVLDQAAPDHPVLVQAWAPVTPNVCALNSLALQRLGITSATPDRIDNVWVEKDPSGEPTGRLHGSVTNYYCDSPFMTGLLMRLPLPQPDAVVAGTEQAMRHYNAMGSPPSTRGTRWTSP
jgi:predicted amidohydrolase YtcJ